MCYLHDSNGKYAGRARENGRSQETVAQLAPGTLIYIIICRLPTPHTVRHAIIYVLSL